jgi:ADP-ribosyl-[dinitrogen reductase] hydrolase
MREHAARLEGGLIGLLVGDALGVPYEFQEPEDLPALDDIDFDPPPGFVRSHTGVVSGTWSDDGAQALCLLASLLECGRLDPDDLGRRLLAWYDEGYLAVDGRVFDVGIQTARALNAIRSGVPAASAGTAGEQSKGNGALMRVLPLALWHRGSDAELVADAHAQSRVTHGHLLVQACCALYCLWARHTLVGDTHAWENAVAGLRAIYAGNAAAQGELEWVIRPDDPPVGTGGGYVVDCLRSARVAVQAGPFEQAVKTAVSLGHDTDTTACVTGGIAGIRDGMDAIPQRWRTRLRGQELVEPLLMRLKAV